MLKVNTNDSIAENSSDDGKRSQEKLLLSVEVMFIYDEVVSNDPTCTFNIYSNMFFSWKIQSFSCF